MTGERPGRERPDTRPAGAGQADGALMLEQPFDARSMYQLRAAIAAHGLAAGMSKARADDLVVAVHELAANVVRHGSGRGRVFVRHFGDMLRCEVAEEGGQPAAAADGERTTAATAAAGAGPGSAGPGSADGPTWQIRPGHGLWLVRKLADHATRHAGPEGVTTTITFSLRSAR